MLLSDFSVTLFTIINTQSEYKKDHFLCKLKKIIKIFLLEL